jgi:hypothetical protein
VLCVLTAESWRKVIALLELDRCSKQQQHHHNHPLPYQPPLQPPPPLFKGTNMAAYMDINMAEFLDYYLDDHPAISDSGFARTAFYLARGLLSRLPELNSQVQLWEARLYAAPSNMAVRQTLTGAIVARDDMARISMLALDLYAELASLMGRYAP